MPDAIAEMNAVLQRTWYSPRVYAIESFNRFVFQPTDAASIDGNLEDDGVTIIHNLHFEMQTPEDAAFARPEFMPGQFVGWERLLYACIEFVRIANDRLNLAHVKQMEAAGHA